MIEEEISESDDGHMDGWGSWAGENIKPNRKVEERRKRKRDRKIAERKAELVGSHVIVNNSRDKKFKKYMVSELPHGYASKAHFENEMNVPLGKEWNTNQSYKRLVQPSLLTKAG